MKLRAIELTNLRRFAGQRARLSGIGDGVSVLAAPNETGKSTLFEGLQALLFQSYSSRSKPVMGLRPHAGGAPEVAAEIETDEGRFRIEKRWLSRPTARVLDARGTLLRQDDEAEAWIARLALADPMGAPTGLVWVRQGAAGIESAGTIETRRALLSSVAGEIEAMTGGRRMDRLRAEVRGQLEALQTLRTAKPRGPWAAAQDELAGFEARESELAARLAGLAEALGQRRALEARRAGLDDPEADAARAAALARAEAEHASGAEWQQRIETARSAHKLAQAETEAAAARHDQAKAQQAALARAEAAHARLAEAGARGLAHEARCRAAHEAAARAEAQAAAAAARAQVAELGQRLARAQGHARDAVAARGAREALAITPARLEAAETAGALLTRLLIQSEAQAVSLGFDYSGAARARLDGEPVEAGLRLSGPVRIELPGLGTLHVDPGARPDKGLPARLAEARGALARALAACGAETLEAARALAREAEGLEAKANEAQLLGKTIAPEGLEALETALARALALAGTGEESAEAEAPATLAALEAEAAETARRARIIADEAREAHATARAELTGAEARAQGAAETLATARTAAEALGDPAPLAELLEQARVAETERRAALADLEAGAPDLALLRAGLSRAKGAISAIAEERGAIALRLAGLDSAIAVQADEGIEEELEELRGRIEAARARERALGFEAATLARLDAALESARGAAREAYFAPVAAELAPLLGLLHPGASLTMQDNSLLPGALLRGGQEEGLEILSGGTREQIAILTRLAFARLLAKKGNPLPIILDDALVQSDETRLEAMFTALHRVAEDQQVIVLTCRQRGYAALGGRALELEIEPV